VTQFFFCCKLFSTKAIPLAECGYQNWRHLPEALSGHERSSSHVEAFGKWKELELQLRLGVSIDQTNQKIQQERVEYWRQILRRLISVIRLIATQNLALRGSSDTLLSAHNGIFLKIVELLGKFDPLMREHIQRSSSKEIKTHYLGKNIQNELISLIVDEIKNRIINDFRSAKYYSLIADCTPDISPKEQMSIIVRFVKINSTECEVEICEHFVGFLQVDETSATALKDKIISHLESLNISIAYMRGQGYDNGANIPVSTTGIENV
jgi:Domain of unknown function (DUF4371)